MKLSVVIVNYNVKYFLEQCLHSVEAAIRDLDAEVFVVDNNSVDGSVEMVREKFPRIRLIANTVNTGFSVANNQAIRESSGEYVLLLNPDTVVELDTFTRSVEFMDAHPDAGGLGIKMVDGSGKYLPESKRGLPTPAVAFYKIFGLSALFPKSKIFGQYHLGYLDRDQTHVVDVLAGAYMMLRRETLEKTGLLDETFFMYGEDIDLSYRITKAGYKNYYYPGARIIHYKGESTKKSSINYVFVFYNAMVIFARKHFSQKNAQLFSFLIHIAIYLRAGVSIIHRLLKRVMLPLADAAVIYSGSLLIVNYWESAVTYTFGGHYPPLFLYGLLPAYILIWLFSVLIAGGYDKPLSLRKVYTGLFAGTVVILVFYALLPAGFRFSRAIIILTGLWGLISMTGIRLTLHLAGFRNYRLGYNENLRFAIVGSGDETGRVADLLRNSLRNPGFIGLVSTGNHPERNEGYIGSIANISDIINIYKIDEVIFCARDIPANRIIDTMAQLRDMEIEFKIAPPESLSIIGSNSISTMGDVYIVDINSITKVNNLRNKRLLDFGTALILLPLFPVLMWMMKNPLNFPLNVLKVLSGFRSWVGYSSFEQGATTLPPVRKGILNPTDMLRISNLDQETILRLNMLYARDYRLSNDLNIFLRSFRHLGRKA
ncbi:glycosyltransferase [Lentimicrobium sp.]|uniref:glycosyltransferase n=1 Tax=Lentimicrobium sp. TaxID=2034841 RepID=UPI002B7C893F|nr:glycosyltransferase [Lentimicrobium sp.]HPJ62253.1 glycosyltransferase [Lentimicrobium sp.]